MYARVLSLLPLLLLGGCSPHTVQREPTPPIELAAGFASKPAQVQSSGQAPERWWKAFGDPKLDELVDAALARNFDMHAAWARVAQARAGADMAGAGSMPSVDASAGAAYRRSSQPPFTFNTPMGTQSSPARTQEGTFLSGSVAASYEVDIWDKLGSTQRAAALDRAAAVDAAHGMAMTLAAEVAEAWFSLVQTHKRSLLLQQQLEANEQFHELLELRFQHGQSTIVDVNQQAQQATGTRAQLALQQSMEEVQRHRLAVLLGRMPGQLAAEAGDELPPLPSLPSAGLPSELLQRRPDLRAAQRRVEAADERIGAAIADRYPSLRLTGSIASEPSSLNDWFMDPIWNLASNLAMPLFDGGRRAAEVERTRGVLAERVADYGKAVLSAVLEVEAALSQERQQHVYLQHVQEQATLAETTLTQARERYGAGQSDFLTVLTTLRAQQQTQLSLLDAHRQLLSYRIQLCRALGGTWVDALEAPQPEGAS